MQQDIINAPDEGELCREIDENFAEVYAKFKIHFYREIFSIMQDSKDSLSIVELFCVELIHALHSPSVNEFSSLIGISAPNAAYKVNSLIKKGFIRKEQSPDDKREYHLVVTDKYYQYYDLTSGYLSGVVRRLCERFEPERLRLIVEVLRVMNDELLSEELRLDMHRAE